MRIAFVSIRVVALAVSVWALVARADCVFAPQGCRADNLISYFTIESNIAFAVLLVILISRDIVRRAETALLTTIRAIVTSYLIVSGATFALLMVYSGLSEYPFLVPLSSKVLHFVLPVFAVIDFLVNPARRRLRWLTPLASLIFPGAYAFYTLLRGSSVGWYPYIFLDPSWVGSYAGVAVYGAALGGAILVLNVGLVAITRLPTVRFGAAAGSSGARGEG